MITAAQLLQIMPNAGPRAALYAPHLSAAMYDYEINTPARQAAFLAQVAHESGELRYVREIASGDAYEGRADLGNTQPGDGRRFKGRGLIQVTGRTNYAALSRSMYDDETILLGDPAQLERPRQACVSAAWFWWSRKLSALADMGKFRDITRKINGGYNGLAERERYWASAKAVLGVA